MISAPGWPNISIAKKHRRLAAWHDHNVTRVDLDAVPSMQIGCNRLAQRQNTIGRRVTVMPVAPAL